MAQFVYSDIEIFIPFTLHRYSKRSAVTFLNKILKSGKHKVNSICKY